MAFFSGAITDSNGNSISAFPAAYLRITDEPRQIFYDPFDAALDTTNLWTTPTVGNSAVIASITAGVLSMGTGTTASGWSKLYSIPSFKLSVPAWTGYSFALAIPDGAAPTANSYRFWGAGTIASTPTTAAPMTDAVGFELSTTGKLYAVVYASGTRTQIQDLSSTGNNTQPLDASMHRFIVYIRTDKVYWYIDGITSGQLVATSNFQSPNIQTLPITMLCVGGATPPGSNSQITCSGAAVWDTGKNSTQLSDGTYPFRKATISSGGALRADTVDIPSVTATAPSTATSTVYENSRVVKASPGFIYNIIGYNSGPSQFLQIHNATSLPSDTAVPVLTFAIPANGNFSLDYSKFGRYLSTGIVVCNSTTGPTKTIGAADCWFDIQYI